MHALNTRTRRYTATHTHKTRGGQGGMDTAGTHTQRSCTRDIQTNISRAFFAHFFQIIFHFYAEKMWKMGEKRVRGWAIFRGGGRAGAKVPSKSCSPSWGLGLIRPFTQRYPRNSAVFGRYTDEESPSRVSRDTVSGPSESAISVCQSLNQLTCPDCLHQIEDISPKSSNPPYPQWGGSGRYFWLPVPSMYPSGGDWLVISEEISVTVFTERDLPSDWREITVRPRRSG